MSAPHAGDKSAAFTGLILGAIAIFVLVFAIVLFGIVITIVKFTNQHYSQQAAAAKPH